MFSSCGNSNAYIHKTIFKHKKKFKILNDNNISNIIIYENANNYRIPPPIIRQSGFSSFLDTDISAHMESLSLLICNA